MIVGNLSLSRLDRGRQVRWARGAARSPQYGDSTKAAPRRLLPRSRACYSGASSPSKESPWRANRRTRRESRARLLRHEVGDLLQSVYATVAILLDRQARRGARAAVLESLRHRSELCRFELDAVVDLMNPDAAPVQGVEFHRLVAASLAQVVPRPPQFAFDTPPAPPLSIRADGRLAAGAVTFLLLAVCQHARRRVAVRLESADGLVRLRIRRDGPGVDEEQERWIDRPFTTTRQSMLGLALAVASRASDPAGAGWPSPIDPRGSRCCSNRRPPRSDPKSGRAGSPAP